MRLTEEQIKVMADRAEARARDRTDKPTKAEETTDESITEALIDAEVERLAPLPDAIYETQRSPCAHRLGVRVSYLDKRVLKRRKELKAAETPATAEANIDELRRSADHIIKNENVLDQFAKEFDKVIAGEVAIGKLLYLVATSRVFSRPMNAAIKGTSSCGKSEVRKRVLEFFPLEDIVSFTSISEKALIYYEGDFVHKILSMGEAHANEEQKFQDYLLRELMSENYIRYPVAQKAGNEIRTITIEKHGPVSFLVTTTKNKLDPENETRMLSVDTDDTADQTKKVFEKVAHVVGMQDAESIDYKPWQDFQRWLAAGECRVVVPFALAIAKLMPTEAVRLRRDFGQILSAIKAHALLHRDRRGRDSLDRVVADIEHDYEAVRKLMNAIIGQSCGAAVSERMLATINAVVAATAGQPKEEGAKAKDIGKLLKQDRSTVWRRLSDACYEGYLVNLEERERRPARYRATEQKASKAEDAETLPTAATLLAEYHRLLRSPPRKSTQHCNTDEIAETFQGDECCGDKRNVATADATVNPLNGNGKSPRVAMLRPDQGGSEKSGNGFRSDIDDAYAELRERGEAQSNGHDVTCAHCGKPSDGRAEECFFSGEDPVWLHPECQSPYFAKSSHRDQAT